MSPRQLLLLLLLALTPATAPAVEDGRDSGMLPHLSNNICYQEDGKAKFCQPQFDNVAVTKPVVASSTCGSPPVRICRRRRGRRSCELCDASRPNLAHPASHLTDYRVHGSCWVSEPLRPGHSSVNLTLSLGKKYVIFYSSFSGCGMETPDAVEVYKSVDFGASWSLWHLFSKNCTGDYGKRGLSYQFKEDIHPKEVICTDINFIVSSLQQFERENIVLTFSTAFNRYSTSDFLDGDPILLDWMLATDIRLVLRRRPRPDTSVHSQPFAFSNIDIGGRCFCNGHASRCIRRGEREVCECAHGTEGDDCERCRNFWVDRPWRRGTVSKAAECKRCDCNSHTERCYFDARSYKFGGSSSGGVCLSCQHHTAGRHCQYCRTGFHRNWREAIESPRACTSCNCHPLGSRSGACDRSTGRCPCKDGVRGDKCDRCKPGYEQSSDRDRPCQRPGERRPPTPRPAAAATTRPPAATAAAADGRKARGDRRRRRRQRKKRKNCPKRCKSQSRRLSQVDYCLRQWVMTVSVLRVRRRRRWMQVTATVPILFKCAGSCGSAPRRVTLWVRRRHWRCRCPRLRPGRTYLLLARNKRHPQHSGDLVLGKRSIVWPWQQQLRPKLQQYAAFIGYYRDGCTDCACVRRQHRRRRRERRRRRRRQRGRKRRRHSGDAAAAAAAATAAVGRGTTASPFSAYLYGGSRR